VTEVGTSATLRNTAVPEKSGMKRARGKTVPSSQERRNLRNRMKTILRRALVGKKKEKRVATEKRKAEHPNRTTSKST